MSSKMLIKKNLQKTQVPRIEIRRSSSLQFPVEGKDEENGLMGPQMKLLENKTSSWASSIYTLAHLSHTSSAMNLYVVMARYRCCFGGCRLRVAACVVSIMCIVFSVIVICSLLTMAHYMSSELQDLLIVPIVASCVFQLASAVMLIVGVLIEHHLLLMPFLLNSILHIVVHMGLCIIFLVSANQLSNTLYPVLAVTALLMIGTYLWFLVIGSMTFVLIRDKKRYRWDIEEEFDENRKASGMMDRVNSSYF